MRSATSFFNLTLYKKNLSRFWPLWVSWLVLWLFVMPLNLINLWRDYSRDDTLYGTYRLYYHYLNLNSDIGEVGMFLGVLFAVLVVMAVFGYLFNHRSAATMHALPLRRETLFVTNYLSGLTFFLLPSIVVYASTALVELVTIPAELSAVTLPALWSGFWIKTGTELFFYSFAVFCAQFTGNVLALPAFYGILNILVYVMYTLCVSIADMIYYGGWPLVGEPALVRYLTPFYALYDAAHWDSTSWSELWNRELNVPLFGQTLELGFEDPGVVAGYAVAGIVLAVLALLVYRRRHIETAGDVVSVKLVRPIFRAGVAVCAGLSGGMVMAAFFGWYDKGVPMMASILIWTVIGFFVAEMLLHKSFRVFKRSWKTCLVTAAVMALAVLACFLDVFGVETWVPKTGEVEMIQVHIDNTFPLDDAAYLNLDIEDAVEVERIVNLHQAIIDDYKAHGEYYYGDHLMSVSLTYQIGGKNYYKSYHNIGIFQDEITAPGTTTYLVNEFVNEPTVIERLYDMEQARKSKIVCAELRDVVYPDGHYGDVEILEGAEEIWAAVQADFAAGNLGRRYLFDDDVRNTETYYTDLNLRFLMPEEKFDGYEDLYYEMYVGDMPMVEVIETEESAYSWNWTMTVTLTPKAERTLAALEKYSKIGVAYDIALH